MVFRMVIGPGYGNSFIPQVASFCLFRSHEESALSGVEAFYLPCLYSWNLAPCRNPYSFIPSERVFGAAVFLKARGALVDT